jgi:hypothetical protein
MYARNFTRCQVRATVNGLTAGEVFFVGFTDGSPKTGIPARAASVQVPAAFFENVAGDVLVLQSGEMPNEDGSFATGELFLVHWRPGPGGNNTQLVVEQITWHLASDLENTYLENACFAPLSLPLVLE